MFVKRAKEEGVGKFSPGTIERLQEGPAWVVVVRGDHDLWTAPGLVSGLAQAVDAAGLWSLIWGVDFMDSAILRALLSAREQALARREGRSRCSLRTASPADCWATSVRWSRRVRTWPRRRPPWRPAADATDAIDVALASSVG